MTSDKFLGLVFVCLGTAVFFASQRIVSNFPGSGDPGPAMLPTALGAFLVLLGLILAFRKRAVLAEGRADAIRGLSSDISEGPNEVVAPPVMWRRVCIGLALLLYIVSFERAGFTVSSFLFVCITMILLDEFSVRQIVRKILVGAGVVLALGYVLNTLLGLSVPGVLIG